MRGLCRIGTGLLGVGVLFFTPYHHPSYAEEFFKPFTGTADRVMEDPRLGQQQLQVAQAGQLRQQRQSADQPSYEPPQPSTDFGTPEATARIAAKAGFLDVVGIKLGMPLKAALEAVKARKGTLRMEPQATLEYEALPGVILEPAHLANLASEGNTEAIGLLTTYPPSEAFVYGVWRYYSFNKPESQPTVDTILTGLQKKYGPESARQDTLLIWLFDTQQQQVMGPKALDIWKKCANHWMTGTTHDVGNINRQITRGYYVGSDGRDYFGGICHSHSLVQVQYMASQQLRSSQPLIMNVQVRATNHQLEASGVTATNVLLMREATQLAEKRKAEASKRSGPKF